MKTYTFEDLTREHNVNEMAGEYQRQGAQVAATINTKSAHHWTAEEWWRQHDSDEILRPLDGYKRSREFLGCSIGVERFAWMNFKQGWNAAKKEASK